MNITIINNLNNEIENSSIRWYLSSQEIWIGKKGSYAEIEESIGRSYGSFRWLFSDSDTLLFDKEKLIFTTGVLKIDEPINVIEGEFNYAGIRKQKGTIKLTYKKNHDYKIGTFSEYYTTNDILFSYNNGTKLNELQIVELTIDFSFLIQYDQIIGWILRNASSHLTIDAINNLDNMSEAHNSTRKILENYLILTNQLNNELTYEEEQRLKRDLENLYENIKVLNAPAIEAIKESIRQVIDFM